MEATVSARWNHLRPDVIRASLKGVRGFREGLTPKTWSYSQAGSEVKESVIRTIGPARNQLASLQEARYATGRSWACSVRK